MTDLHPQWRSIDDDKSAEPVPVRVTQTESAPQTVQIVPASRLPAAVVGIALVLGLGFIALQNTDALSGLWQAAVAALEVSPAPLELVATANGLVPSAFTVQPGQIVSIRSERTDAPVFTSATLHTGTTALLQTPAIFQGTSYSFIVSAMEQLGTIHSIVSTTPGLSALVTIGSVGASASSQGTFGGTLSDVPLPGGQGGATVSSRPRRIGDGASSAFPSTVPPILDSTGTPAVVANTDTPATASSASSTTVLPYNPFTIAAQNGGKAPLPGNGTALHAGAPLYPNQNPQTGPEVWVVLAGSLAVLCVVVRKQMVGYTRQ